MDLIRLRAGFYSERYEYLITGLSEKEINRLKNGI